MENPNIKTIIRHSDKNLAWNVISTRLGGKFKIARVPYTITHSTEINEMNKREAKKHAEFISYCFNNSEKIISI